MAAWSISRRLIKLLTVSLAALWLMAAIASGLVMNLEINELFDSTLQEAAQRLLPLAIHDQLGQTSDARRHDENDDDEHTISDALEIAEHDEYLIYQLRDASGQVLLRSHDAPIKPFPIALRRGYTDLDGWRYYTETHARDGLYLQVAEPMAHRFESVGESLVWLAAPLVLLLPLSGMAIFLTVRRTMKPIGTLGTAIGARSGSDLSPIDDQIDGDAMPEELAPIVQDVNHLLARLEKALAHERAFAANSAHELRTPVAAALAQTQRLAVELKSTPHGDRIGRIAATLHRLGDLVEKLLQLSRADAGLALSRDPTDTMPALRLVIDEFARRPDLAGRIRFDPGHLTALNLRIDVDAFGIVVRNLIGNALAYGTEGGPEDGAVNVFIDEDRAIHVVNGGDVVPPERLAKLTHRFERGVSQNGGESGTQGSGLGLAIVETIMAQSGGSLALNSPATGRVDGFEAVVRFAD